MIGFLAASLIRVGIERRNAGRLLPWAVSFMLFINSGSAFAAHPLITDDAGTQEKGKAQLEFIGEYGREKESAARTESLVLPVIPVLSYGMTGASDLIVGISYAHIRTSDATNTATARGISDAVIDVKWRFFAQKGLSLAVKPGASLPTGNADWGLGSGRVGYHLFFIASEEAKPWAIHFNSGYIRNENRIDERRDLWLASIAGVTDIVKNLKMVADIGTETARDKDSGATCSFILAGLIYSISENVDLDAGIKKGFNNRGTDYSIPAGITWRL